MTEIRLRILALGSMLAITPGMVSDAQVVQQTPAVGDFVLGAAPAELLGAEGAARFSSIVDPEESLYWDVRVPESYDPASPPGLLVYISPSNSGRIPRGWPSVLDERNLVWAAAEESGNRIPVARRIALALMAVGLINDRYKLDSNRVFLAGFSGGARVAGLAATVYPSIFRGAIYIGGAEPWEDAPEDAKLARLRENRYVFVVGSLDGNRSAARRVASLYEDAGVAQIESIIIRHGGHELPGRRHFAQAVEFLDGPNSGASVK